MMVEERPITAQTPTGMAAFTRRRWNRNTSSNVDVEPVYVDAWSVVQVDTAFNDAGGVIGTVLTFSNGRNQIVREKPLTALDLLATARQSGGWAR